VLTRIHRVQRAEESRTVGTVLAIVGLRVGSIMGIGALFGALNTMYSAVSTRAVEIATLRALGFGALPIVTSVLTEAMLLAPARRDRRIFGWLFFNGHTVSSAAGGSGRPANRAFSVCT